MVKAGAEAGGDDRFTPTMLLSIVAISLVVSASYPYMLLKMGMGPSVNALSGVLAFLLLKAIGQRRFSARANNLVQTAASSAATAAFMSVPLVAMDQMGFVLDPVRTFLWANTTTALGVLMAAPLMRHYIEVEKLKFPSGEATAQTLISLEDPNGPGRARAMTVGVFGVASMTLGFLKDGLDKIPGAFFATPYGLGLEFSPMLAGSGMLMGLRNALWMLGASLLFWGAIAPLMIHAGMGMPVAEVFHLQDLLAQGKYFAVLTKWTLWPAVAFMVANGLASLALNWKLIMNSFHSLTSLHRSDIPLKPLLIGVAALVLLHGAVQYSLMGISPILTIVSVALAFPLMLICIKATGETDLTPVSVMGSATQAAFAGISPGSVATSLTTAASTAGIAASAGDLANDFKTGHILGSSRKKMLVAQLIGIPIGGLVLSIVYPMLKAVYGFGPEGLVSPMSQKWVAFAEILNRGLGALPPELGPVVAVAAVAGVMLSLLERRWPNAAPSGIVLGLALLLPGQMMATAALGAAVAWLAARAMKGDGEGVKAVGSGLIIGEALAAVLISGLKFFKLL
ncbi:MAG: OPT/YSL family transporter [Elusimicrobia bacterium]|nr:OPT/YSL family transporter [Elusimicrobiota bacterium]